tara:strand:- start:215 stop:790 length:576 start_codon:yes stop_codon:yes gene_type:complete
MLTNDHSNHDLITSPAIMVFSIDVSTMVQPYEDIDKVFLSIKSVFPDWEPNVIPVKEKFPTNREEIIIKGISKSLDTFIEFIRKQRILDTAFDVMTLNMHINTTEFIISRQSAIKHKISFVIDESPLGGTIKVKIEKDNLEIWLEDQTWHNGRENIPRQARDDLAMKGNGEAVEWFDKFGNPTMASDWEEE